jgi:hypothetical protein
MSQMSIFQAPAPASGTSTASPPCRCSDRLAAAHRILEQEPGMPVEQRWRLLLATVARSLAAEGER